jgi:DNA processing protein
MTIIKLTLGNKFYPDRLRQLSSPPETINISGNGLEEILRKPTLGVVGSRKATAYGKNITETLVESVVDKNVVIVSGLALGIDSISHKAALDKAGQTIAVLPGGIKQIYPATHRSLARNITKQNGLLISEYDNDFRPRRESFIQRNRIIAALSDALLITEAAEKSGTMHTANFALELGKPVLAVPGNINSPMSMGTNNLIKSGAFLVTDEQDIYSALGIKEDKLRQEIFLGDTDEETMIINLMRSGVSAGEEIHIKSELPIEMFQQALTMLEIKGIVKPLGNNHWQLT